MQNLPITSTPPVTSAQTPAASSDNNATQATESFGSVLARQNANANEPGTDTPSNGQPSSPSADSTAATAILDNKLIELQTPVPDGASALPNDILAALLPTAANMGSAAADEKTGLRKPASDSEEASLLAVPTPDEISALPNAVLATLAPAPKISQGADTSGQLQTVAAGVPGGKQEPAGNKLVAPSLFRAQDNATPSVTTVAAKASAAQTNTFSSALETSGKDTANTTLFNIGTAQTYSKAAQPDAATLASLTQASTAPITPSQNVPAQAAINTPVTHDSWGNEFNQKITWLATQNEQSAELHLNPPNLGPLNVVLKVSGDQATAMFTSPHAAVREAVEQALPRLREMMADNGITLGNAMVSDQSPKEHQKGGGNSFGRAGGFMPADSGIQAGGTVAPVHRHQGMVDTFA